MASFTVYLTINKINNKVYIGQTNNNDPYYIGSGKLLKKAIKKYKRSVFKRFDLIKCNTAEEVNKWEKFYIDLFDAKNPEIGYNIREGGKNPSFFHLEESKLKIKNRANQIDNKIRIRSIQKQAVQKRIGSHHSLESKLKIIKTKFGIVKTIQIFDKDMKLLKECNTSREASIYTNIGRSSIANNLCGLSNSTKNYIFKYKEVSIV